MRFNYWSWPSCHKGHKNNCSREQVFHEKAKEFAFQGTKLVAFYHQSTKVSATKRVQLWALRQSRVVAHWGKSSQGHLPPLLPAPSASPAPGPLLLLRPAWHPQHPGLFPGRQAVPAHGLPAELLIFAKIQVLTWKACI